MVFSSVLFLSLFLPSVLGIYFLSQNSFRNYLLLGASLLFYSWGEPTAALIMVALITISYFIGLKLETASPKYKKFYLAAGILINLSALFFYKYWMFFISNVNIIAEHLHLSTISVPDIALPIGISFYVFQIISYLIDVFRKEVRAQNNLFLLATYVSLFPQLIAGPIVRYQTIENDLKNRATDLNNVFIGTRRFVLGLAKKVLIADQVALIADKIFDTNIETVPCLFAWLGVLAYTLQIYFDFSAYSDMAIGLGKIFNFNFLENFNYPYSAKSIQDFWRRWHISLSTWFRDYLYIPLGGNRKGNIRTFLNCYIVFGLCGLWHGASWNFVLWGLYHGTGLMLEKLGLNSLLAKLPQILANLYVWLFVIIGWVFFRAADLSHAWSFLQIMFTGNDNAPLNTFVTATDFLTYSNILALFVGIILSYPIFGKKYEKFRQSAMETLLIFLLFLVSFVFATTSTFSPFIYFRF